MLVSLERENLGCCLNSPEGATLRAAKLGEKAQAEFCYPNSNLFANKTKLQEGS